MAMTFGRWLAVLALGSAVVAVALLPPDDDPASLRGLVFQQTRAGFLRESVATIQRGIVDAASRLTEERWKQRVGHRLGATPHASLVVSYEGPVPDPIREEVERVARDQADRLHLTEPSDVRIAVHVVATTSTRTSIYDDPTMHRLFTHSQRVAYMLPDQLDGRACAVFLLLGPNGLAMAQRNGLLPGILDLGPCAFYAAFGEPGPHIASWIHRRTVFAGRADWNDPPQPIRVSSRPERRPSIVSTRADLQACLAGRSTWCERLVLGPSRGPLGRTRLRAAPRYQVVRRADYAITGYEDHMLSDMVRDLGPTRFQAFWTSDAPVVEAFRQASGEDFGTWITGWTRAMIGAWHWQPLAPVASLAWATVLCAVTLGGAMAWAERRS